MDAFQEAYKNLNPEQKKAVDTIDGPVMVVAGPGTGKTQVLSLRIANIRVKTDTSPDSILCLTFTNAGVKAMRERLMRYMGAAATKVRVSTFHNFGIYLIEKYHLLLGFQTTPELMADAASNIAILDQIFYSRDWEYLRPRANPTLYFRDLKALISILKRDGISVDDFRAAIKTDVKRLEDDPTSISTRGETKGQMKKDVQKKIEGLQRTLEVADFYDIYEATKKEKNVIDFDDVLKLMVRIARENEDAREEIRLQYQYILIDEHQDSTGIQNEFLKTVWQDTDQPNIFVVGDDRQLIYGFGGASLSHFEGFKNTFGKATLITLTANYRSTQSILDSAEALLQSTMAEGKLVGSTKEAHSLQLIETDYPRDEIIAAGMAIKEKVKAGVNIDDCAILMPKNRQVKAATEILRDMGLQVAAESTLKLFELPDTEFLLQTLQVINSPFNGQLLSKTLLYPLSLIPPLTAHKFLHENDLRKMSVEQLVDASDTFISAWGTKLSKWIADAQEHDLYALIQIIGNELLLNTAGSDEVIRQRVEIIRTILNLVSSFVERGEKVTLENFIMFVNRLQEYNEDIPLAVFAADRGVKVLTFHGSKGLEFDFVWIAHMDEKSLMGSRRQVFVLPADIETSVEEHDEEVAKRQLYVAITRAKRFCTISYARHSNTGNDQQLADIIAVLPENLFVRMEAKDTEAMLVGTDPRQYVARHEIDVDNLQQLKEVVAKEYCDREVSVTMLNNFFECPWKWYFRNLLQLPEPQTEPLHLGNVAHKTIEYILRNDIEDGEKIEEYIQQCADIEARHNGQLAKRLVTQVKKIVKSWLKLYRPKLVRPYEIEQKYTYYDPQFPELRIGGKVDVEEHLSDTTVRVTDWKTGNPKTKYEVEKRDEEGRLSNYLRQLAMYAYLIEGSSNKLISTTEERLIFIEAADDANAVVSRKVSPEDVNLLRKDIKDYKEFIETGEWMARPCCAKSYGQDTSCEYCAMAERLGVKEK